MTNSDDEVSNDELDPPEATGGDHLHTLARVGLSATPIVGGTFEGQFCEAR